MTSMFSEKLNQIDRGDGRNHRPDFLYTGMPGSHFLPSLMLSWQKEDSCIVSGFDLLTGSCSGGISMAG